MIPKKRTRTKEKGTWTVGIDDKEVPVTGKFVLVTNADGTVRRNHFKAKGNLPDGTKVKINEKARFK
jgi:hypothetical protein